MFLLVTLFTASVLSAQKLEEQEISLSEQTAALEEGISTDEWSFLFGDEDDEALVQMDDDE